MLRARPDNADTVKHREKIGRHIISLVVKKAKPVVMSPTNATGAVRSFNRPRCAKSTLPFVF